ncbi:hypothetical protein DER45DRAFT_541042 [Fusarium avenaceum]|nr:hypothetical protein DER45DRAFT_541042 [Fusarium avenaceum]
MSLWLSLRLLCQTTVTRRASARDRRLNQTPSTVSQPDRVAVLEERLATIEALLAVFTGQTSAPEPQPHPSALNNVDHSSSSSDRTASEAHTPLDVSAFQSAAITDPLPQTVKAPVSDQLELAPLSEILPVVDKYFRNYNAIIPLFDETAFMRMLLDWFAGSTKRNMISWAAINTVLAISYRIVEGRPMDDPEFAQCTQNVRSVMSDLMMQGKDLMGLQVLLGMIILFQGSPDFQLAIVLTASVVRLTQSLGLHLKQAQAGFSRPEQAHRRRLFWLSYIYDKELAQRSQSPYLQLDSETDMDLPEPEDDLGVISSSTDNICFNYLRTIAKFAFIQGKAHDLLYSHKSQKLTQEQKTNTIVRIEDMLEEWTREIPIELHTAEGIEKRLPPISRDLMMSLWFHHAECRVKIRSIFTFEDAWITRVRRYLFPTLIDVSDDIVGKVRRGDLPPLPPKWSQCVEYSRICMELLIARQPSEYIIW